MLLGATGPERVDTLVRDMIERSREAGDIVQSDEVGRAMLRLREDRTAFVIAHRLSTIRDADLILVMEDGAIVEQGNHDELLEQQGAYWRLYNAQFEAPMNSEIPVT